MNKFIVLGSGSPFSSFYKPFDFRYPSGYLLQHNNKNYLIDCSEGIRQRLEHLKVDYFNIENVFLSHFHPDHFNIETLIQAQMVRNYFVKAKKTLTIYGPPELKNRLETIWDAKHFKGHFKNKLPEYLNLKIIEYQDEQLINIDNMQLTPFPVVHGNMPSYALMFKFENKILSYSGDSGFCPGIEKVSKQSDLFVCESFESIDNTNPGHLNASQAGEIALKNNVKHLVLTHLTNINSNNELLETVKKTGYKGKVTVATDYLSIDL